MSFPLKEGLRPVIFLPTLRALLVEMSFPLKEGLRRPSTKF